MTAPYKNYFNLLNLEQSFDINQTTLKSNYLALQVIHHPDRANNENEKKHKLEYSIQLNEAYKIIKNDYLRAEYLLRLIEEATFSVDKAPALQTDELEEFLTLFEKIDKADLTDIVYLEKLNQEINQKYQTTTFAISRSFAVNDLVKVQNLVIKLKYLTNLVGNIKIKVNNANN